jgi:hypothetical protein
MDGDRAAGDCIAFADRNSGTLEAASLAIRNAFRAARLGKVEISAAGDIWASFNLRSASSL